MFLALRKTWTYDINYGLSYIYRTVPSRYEVNSQTHSSEKDWNSFDISASWLIHIWNLVSLVQDGIRNNNTCLHSNRLQFATVNVDIHSVRQLEFLQAEGLR